MSFWFQGDFGCGPGILGIAASTMGCASVLGFDIGLLVILYKRVSLQLFFYYGLLDESALETCWVNIQKLEIENFDIIHSDLDSIGFANGISRV